MKKLVLILCLWFCTLLTYANKHFYFDLEGKNISLSEVENLFYQWFELAPNTTFKITRDYVDNLGIRHINYQQYYNGLEVENSIIMIHLKSNKITSANGCILEKALTPNMPKKAKYQQVNKNKNTNIVIISTYIDGEIIYRPAYKKIDLSKNVEIYVDAETEEILKEISLFSTADTDAWAYTMYNGIQPITCYNTDDYFFLMDSSRQILTVDATKSGHVFSDDDQFNLFDTITGEVNYDFVEQRILEYILRSDPVIRTSNVFANVALSSVTITSVSDDWWSSLFDNTPDLFIEIYDSNDNLLYTAIDKVKEDTYPPVTFNTHYVENIPVAVDMGCKIKIYESDLTSNDYGGMVTINLLEPGTYTWSTNNHSGELTLVPIDAPILDAHWGMEQTYDYFYNVFNRKSFDANGAPIYQIINSLDTTTFRWPSNNAAAFNFAPYPMLYGIGDGINVNSVVSLDVMAHEFMHLITNKNGNGGLVYQGESGALNESFSDIFGCAVEFYVKKDNANWLLGEDVIINYSNLRSMQNPKLGKDGFEPSPDTYNGEYWQDPSDVSKENDNGGVHINSGVQNYWFYLLSEGGSGINDVNFSYSVEGIGIKDAEQIAYRNLITYLTPMATYQDARIGSLLATKDLFGENSMQYKSVQDAWNAVGVIKGDNTTTALINKNITHCIVYSQDKDLYINTPIGTPIQVIDLLGNMIYNDYSNSTMTILRNINYPMVIVKTNENILKIIIK